MKRIRNLAATTLAVCLTVPATAQVVDVEANGTRVQVGGEAGVQVDSQQPSRTATYDDRVEVRSETVGSPRRLQSQSMASWLLIDQQLMQQLAQFGLTRTKTPEVRELAETVLRDHAALAERLQPLASAKVNAAAGVNRAEVNAEQRQAVRDRREETRDAIRDQREQTRDARRAADGVIRPIERLADRVEDGVERVAEAGQNVAEATRETIDANLGDDRVAGTLVPGAANDSSAALHREIALRTAEMARNDLERRNGYEFDAAFVGMIEAAHLQEQATVEVMVQYADEDLRVVLEDALATVKQHRQAAGQVMHNLKP